LEERSHHHGIKSVGPMEKSKGLGDTIEKVTMRTGIKRVVKVVSNLVGVDDCGCDDRRDSLNEMFPYKNK